MSIEQGTVIYVKLMNEVVDVWRPVQAIQISENRYKLYAASLISTLWPSQNAMNLNLWCKPEVCDAI
ncbi:hypothetical protein, partial [Agrobacterium sp. NPDC089420]|uniref:hypothetical protein n=1 Tax=Agrobacterium sp. NPDC089420 TaxID=3363918 RepID=UPI00384E4DF5